MSAVYLHIGPTLLECVYQVSAVLLGISYKATHKSDANQCMSQAVPTPAVDGQGEGSAEPSGSIGRHIVLASKAIKMGKLEDPPVSLST